MNENYNININKRLLLCINIKEGEDFIINNKILIKKKKKKEEKQQQQQQEQKKKKTEDSNQKTHKIIERII